MTLDGLELSMWTRLAFNSDPAAPASQMLGLKVHITVTVFKRFIYFYFGCYCFACMHVCVPCLCLVPSEVRTGHWVPETGITDRYEPPDGAGNQTRVLSKRTKCQPPAIFPDVLQVLLIAEPSF